ncbi:MAG: hypothetical protein R3A43_03045 [Bacteroidia bacterium]
MNNWDNLKPEARVWVYASKRLITTEEQNEINEILSDFCANWAAHGDKLDCGYTILNNQFILLAVDEDAAAASGCSIDKSVHIFQEIDRKFDLDLFNRLRVYLFENEKIETLNTSELKYRITNNSFDKDSLVVNTLVSNLSELNNQFIVPSEKTWLNRYF